MYTFFWATLYLPVDKASIRQTKTVSDIGFEIISIGVMKLSLRRAPPCFCFCKNVLYFDYSRLILAFALVSKSTVDRSRNVISSHLEYNITPPQVSALLSFHESDNGYNHTRITYVIYQGKRNYNMNVRTRDLYIRFRMFRRFS